MPPGAFMGTKCPLAENQCSGERDTAVSKAGRAPVCFATKQLIKFNSPQLLYLSKKLNNIEGPLQLYYPIASDVSVCVFN